MAEGGDLTSINDGSDADFDVTCTPCGEDNIRAEAYKYCLECQEYLCTTCTRHHGRPKATRSHKLLDKDAVKQGSTVTMATKCRYHPDRDIEMYCETHDMVYCAKCIAKEHRSCSGVKDIEDLQLYAAQQKEIQHLQDDTMNTQECLKDIDETTQNNIDSLEEQRRDILAKIEAVVGSVKEHIEGLKLESISSLNKHFTSAKDELTSNTTLIANMKEEIENAKKQLQTLTSMDVRQQFVQIKQLQKSVKDAVKLVEDSEAKGGKALCFTVKTDLHNSVMATTTLGHVKTVTVNKRLNALRLIKVTGKKEINMKLRKDRTICYICDTCQLQDGTIILADSKHKKIKRLGMNYSINDYCDLDAMPSCICCTAQNEIAVKLDNNKVQFISVSSSLSKLRDISVEGGGYWGIAYCAGELWVSTGSGVNVYSTSGTLLKTISKDINGRKIFKSTVSHMAVSGETVIVTDNSDGAICLGKDGTVKRELRDGRLDKTAGVCISRDGVVLLSGYDSNNIVMFDKNGRCLGQLVAEDDRPVHPISLCYDDSKSCIIVTCATSDKVIIFDISA